MRKNLTNAEIIPAAIRGEDAMTTTGNMSTDAYRLGFTRGGAPYTGSLPRVWSRWLDSRFREGAISQVIYSYSTPIAWNDSTYGWTVPDESYSVTTSGKHQNHLWKIRDARTVTIPYDATPEDVQRVMSHELIFVTKGYGINRVFTGTRPGPNYLRENTDPVVLAWINGHDLDDTAQDARNYLTGTICECCGVDFGGAL